MPPGTKWRAPRYHCTWNLSRWNDVCLCDWDSLGFSTETWPLMLAILYVLPCHLPAVGRRGGADGKEKFRDSAVCLRMKAHCPGSQQPCHPPHRAEASPSAPRPPRGRWQSPVCIWGVSVWGPSTTETLGWGRNQWHERTQGTSWERASTLAPPDPRALRWRRVNETRRQLPPSCWAHPHHYGHQVRTSGIRKGAPSYKMF